MQFHNWYNLHSPNAPGLVPFLASNASADAIPRRLRFPIQTALSMNTYVWLMTEIA